MTKHSKYKIMAPTEMLMALQIKKWPHIFPTSGAIDPTTSFAFLGPDLIILYICDSGNGALMQVA